MYSIPAAAAPTSKYTPRFPHADAAAQARTDLTGGAAGQVRTETLPNGVRMVIAERPGAASVKVQVGVGAGSNQDPAGKVGLAHYLEHMGFHAKPTHGKIKPWEALLTMGGWNAYTDRDSVVYYGVVPHRDAKQATSLLSDVFKRPGLDRRPGLDQELAAVKNEMIFGDGSVGSELWHIHERLVHGDGAATNNVIGTRKTVDAITRQDLKKYHDAYYTGRNTVALVEGDPKRLPLEQLRKELGALEAGARVDQTGIKGSFAPGKAIQVVKDKTHGAIDLSVTIPIEKSALEGLSPARVDLVVTSLGNELFERLRLQKDLTYGGGAKLVESDAADGRMLLLEASVAPGAVRKATQVLVDTAEDAIDGFGPKTLQRDKRGLLSSLRQFEAPVAKTVSARAEQAFQDALLKPGISVPPDKAPTQREADKLRRVVGSITGKQFADTAKQIIKLDNLKVLAFGNVDAADVRSGLTDAGLDAGSFASNPVDLSMYRDMGHGKTEATSSAARASHEGHGH